MTNAQMHEIVTEAARNGHSAEETIANRITGLSEWIEQNAPECGEQAHLDESPPERGYWHCGYLQALIDVQALLLDRHEALH